MNTQMSQPLLLDTPRQAQPALCPECNQMKPADPTNLQDTVGHCHDWRQADRERLEDPIPKSAMCHACFRRIRAEYSPLAPRWPLEDGGAKRYPTDEEIAEMREDFADELEELTRS